MATKLQPLKDPEPPGSFEEFEELLHDTASRGRTIDELHAKRSKRIAAIDAAHEQQVQPYRETYNKGVEHLLDYLVANYPAVFGTKKSRELLDAKLSYVSSDELEVKDEDKAIQTLKNLDRMDLIQVKETLKKIPIKDDKDLIKRIPSLALKHNLSFSITFKPNPPSDASPAARQPKETRKVNDPNKH